MHLAGFYTNDTSPWVLSSIHILWKIPSRPWGGKGMSISQGHLGEKRGREKEENVKEKDKGEIQVKE